MPGSGAKAVDFKDGRSGADRIRTGRVAPIQQIIIPTRVERDRWPALDGLRGLAILLVFAFHLPLNAFRSGSYGVVVFFVLSGFLITTILLKELERWQRPQLRWFYGRRAIRLLPALVMVIFGYLILQATVLDGTARWWGQSWPALFYMSNYALEMGHDLGHLTHTWSLAIEEHFYLVWPLTLIAIPARRRLAVAWGIALLFTAERVGLLALGADVSRVYYLTDTNAFAPLLGCALAISHRQAKLPAFDRNVAGLSFAGLIALSLLPWDPADRRSLYMAVLVALLSVTIIWTAITTHVEWLEYGPLRWFGTISYGLYLWHGVLIPLPWQDLGIEPLIPMLLAPIALATASYYLLEAPLLRKWRRFERRRRRVDVTAQPAKGGGLEPVPAE